MNTPENFINWLEGFLDACKNNPSPQQIKEIRKKISALPSRGDRQAINRVTGEVYNPLWNTQIDAVPVSHFTTIGLVPPGSDIPNNGPLDEAFMAEIEKRKSATTLDELAD
jgi:hypothetical protein